MLLCQHGFNTLGPCPQRPLILQGACATLITQIWAFFRTKPKHISQPFPRCIQQFPSTSLLVCSQMNMYTSQLQAALPSSSDAMAHQRSTLTRSAGFCCAGKLLPYSATATAAVPPWAAAARDKHTYTRHKPLNTLFNMHDDCPAYERGKW